MFDDTERRLLLDTARRSIAHGLRHGQALPVEPTGYPAALRETRATFVTLERRGRLRGCIGTLEAHQPLVCDVADHAYAAAFNDPRFPPLTLIEAEELVLHISVLTPPEPLACGSEAELLARLRPGVDGLILEDDTYRATFLPAVWDDLPEPAEFLTQLKLKAGLPAEHWSATLRFRRYRTISVAE